MMVEEMTNDGKLVKEIIPLNGIRKMIADRMTESMSRSPQATVTTKADMTELLAYRNKLKTGGVEYSITDLVVKVIALALQENPIMNASRQGDKIYVYESVNVGIAVATENYLTVPVIKNVERKGLSQISQEVKDLVKRARTGTLRYEDISGGTFTLSNLGMFDVDVMTPILNIPEAGIVAIGPFHKEAVFDENDTMHIRQRASVCLTIDHAVTDGVPAAKFLNSINKILLNPTDYLI